MSSKSHNEAEVQSLQGEGGSDVFTTTRHINNPNQQQQVSRNWKLILKFFFEIIILQKPYFVRLNIFDVFFYFSDR